jgi:protein-S-isoprenylcysteine O-methyltransferase Ste14
MARPKFKKQWIRLIPKPIERSTYVLVTSIVLMLIMWLWQPLPSQIWYTSNQMLRIFLWSIYALGWILVFISTRLINDKHLFGLQQVVQHKKGEKITDPKFQTPAFYKFTRHPMMLGFIIAFWATPYMSTGHLVYSSVFTLYIFFGIWLEEKDLSRHFNQSYRQYQKKVPMLIPGTKFNFSQD